MEDLVPRSRERTLTQEDYVRLTRLLCEGGRALAGADDVQRTLEASRLVPSQPVAPGLITMGAQVFLATGRQEQLLRLTLCLPDDADPARGRISVLSPLGSSLIGLCSGQTVTWRSFGRTQSASILAVLAPLRRHGGADA